MNDDRYFHYFFIFLSRSFSLLSTIRSNICGPSKPSLNSLNAVDVEADEWVEIHLGISIYLKSKVWVFLSRRHLRYWVVERGNWHKCASSSSSVYCKVAIVSVDCLNLFLTFQKSRLSLWIECTNTHSLASSQLSNHNYVFKKKFRKRHTN